MIIARLLTEPLATITTRPPVNQRCSAMTTPTIEAHEKLLDETGWRILHALQEDARISYAELVAASG